MEPNTLRIVSGALLLGAWLLGVLWIIAFGELFGQSVYEDGFIGWTIVIVASVVLGAAWSILEVIQKRRHV